MTANDLFAAAPELMKKWTAASLAIASSMEPTLIRLVEIRASQINRCANCINMHAAEAREKGETEAMLAADVSVHADGGGKRPAAMRPIFKRLASGRC